MKKYSVPIKYFLLKIKNRLLQGKPVLVLMYHRINDVVDPFNNHLTVSISHFEEQLQFFQKHFDVIRLNDSWKKLKKNGLVITFDDGYADNYQYALPLLKKYNLPATFFICSQNIGSIEEFWWDRLVTIYERLGEEFYISLKHKKTKKDFSKKQIVELLSSKSSLEIKKWLFDLEQLNGLVIEHRKDFRSLNFKELKSLNDEELIDVELHGHTHPHYSDLSLKEQVLDLKSNIDFLEKNIGKIPFNYVAMPHGAYNPQTFELIKKLNLKGFLLANNYYSNAVNKEKKKINRILMPSIEGEKLRKYLQKFMFPF